METKANHLLIGAFTLIVFLGAALFILWLSRFQLDAQFAYYDVRFDDGITGLPIGGEVRYSGVKVGSVSSIHFDPTTPSTVFVQIKIVHKKDFAIREDSKASLQYSGITGITFILIDGGSVNSTELPIVVNPHGRLPVIVAQPSTVKQIFRDAPEITAKVRDALDRINGLLTPDNQRKISRIIDNLDHLSGNLADASVDVKAAAKNLPEFATEAHAAAKSVTDLGVLAQSVVNENRDAVRSFSGQSLAEVGAFTAQARQLTATLDRIAARLESDPSHFIMGSDRSQEVPIRK